MLKPGQPGVEQLTAVRFISDAGENIRQIDQDTVLVHPASTVQVGACPAAVLIADIQPVAALVLQQGKGDGGGDRRGLGAAALGFVDGESLVAAVPGGGASHVQLEAAGGSVGVGAAACVGGKSRDREHTDHHDNGQQPGNCPLPVRFHIFYHEIVPPHSILGRKKGRTSCGP